WSVRTDVLFFFSSRRRHTRWPRDWSSDVCSSDLLDARDRWPLQKIRSTPGFAPHGKTWTRVCRWFAEPAPKAAKEQLRRNFLAPELSQLVSPAEAGSQSSNYASSAYARGFIVSPLRA